MKNKGIKCFITALKAMVLQLQESRSNRQQKIFINGANTVEWALLRVLKTRNDGAMI